ncbi:unnamed protein product [Cuscuta campestris]|uniref:Ninja-family protein n=1 Tax=Cuscuta campestris TaxID=132261 RepID=A0A484KVH6_9ASTE|nr:unnamed protein product [Cuscuta campestris]
MGSLPLLDGVSGDPFLQLCVDGSFSPAEAGRGVRTSEGGNGGEDGIELSLGLSLNGKFGLDPNKAQNMKRACSVSNLPEDGVARAISTHAPLTRACSSPAEAETEEWRKKKKDAQMHKRLEAKRKRMEKINSTRNVRGKLDKEEEDGNPLLPSHSPGSSLSQGSGSSGISDFESQPLPVSGKNMEARSPSVQSEEEPIPPVTVPEPAVKKDSSLQDSSPKDNNGVLRNLMMNMPCVSTKGEGPNGRKIEGFLYRYKKGEEVRIVCVCHGSFLTPAEFVKHAGGGDVSHPLKHIIVTPSCFF